MELKKERLNILILGLGSSGSSAVVDLLREYENINVFHWEFDDFRAPGLVADQLGKESSNDYPNRIDKVIKMQKAIPKYFYYLMPGIFWKRDFNCRILKYLKSKSRIIRLNQIYFLNEFNKVLKSDISFEEKIHLANNWIQDVSGINSYNRDYVVFNQPLDPRSDINIWTRVFEPFKLIGVYRDPKDQLTELIIRGSLFAPFGLPRMTFPGVNLLSLYGRYRAGMLQFFVDALKHRMESFDKLEKNLASERVLLIDFEGLVTKYDKYKTLIEKFIGLKDMHHKHRKRYFDPDISVNNIGKYHNYLSKADIKTISELDPWYLSRLKQCGIN